MSARNSDDGRVREIYRVIAETNARLKDLHLDKNAFLTDDSAQGRMNADGIFMCVFRMAEEAGNISKEVQAVYPDIPWRAIYGMRNIFAHDYGKLDRAIIWSAITDDFPVLKAFCEQYAQDREIDL